MKQKSPIPYRKAAVVLLLTWLGMSIAPGLTLLVVLIIILMWWAPYEQEIGEQVTFLGVKAMPPGDASYTEEELREASREYSRMPPSRKKGVRFKTQQEFVEFVQRNRNPKPPVAKD